MIKLFIEFKEIDLFCEEIVRLELDKYLDILEDNYQRARIERLIRHKLLSVCSEHIYPSAKLEYRNLLAYMRSRSCSFENYELYKERIAQIIEQSKVNEILDRSAIMSSLIWALGARTALVYTEVVCECAVKIFKRNGYQNLIKYDKNLLLNIDNYEKPMIVLILKFRFSKHFMSYHSGCSALLRPETLTNVFYDLKKIYPAADDLSIFECLMYYSFPLTKYANDDDPRIVQICRMLLKNELDFFKLTRRILRTTQNTVEINALFTYAKQIDCLYYRLGQNWKYFFNNKIPDIKSLEHLMFARANDTNLSKLSR